MEALLSRLIILLAPSLYKFLWNKGSLLLKMVWNWIYKNTIRKYLDKGATQKFDEVVKKPDATREERRNAENDFYN